MLFNPTICFMFAAVIIDDNHPMNTQVMLHIIADNYKNQPILKAWLFGSFALGKEPPTSDVDLRRLGK